MFEKHKSSKQEPVHQQPTQDNYTATASTPANSGRAAVIGPGIYVNGDISGDENLVIEGKVDGKIRLPGHQVDVGQNGRVNADITAKVIKIAGEIRGDLNGMEKVVILQSGNVHGNIVAPRMTLEDGAIFKGSIDMDPGEPAKTTSTKPVKKVAEKMPDKPAETPKVAATGSVGKNSSYSLHGG
jgi:cytoskeletal protein CcmA (bactofilin family)